MCADDRTRVTRSLVWGIFLMVLGSAFVLDRAGVIELPNIGELWPLVFGVIAIGHILGGRYASALMFLVLGAWFFAVEFEWYGLTYRNSWPVVLVAVGASIVVRALGGEPSRRRLREGGGS